jgi:hypothetical protein
MAFVAIKSYWLGADRYDLVQNQGTSQPTLASANATDPGVVRVVFSEEMFMEEVNGTLADVLKGNNYHVTEQVSGTPLPVLRVRRVNATTVDLLTGDMTGVTYNISVDGAMDIYGNEVSSAGTSFIGLADIYPTGDNMFTFTTSYVGMQEAPITDIAPDLDPPYVTNRDPIPGQIDVHHQKVIEFDLLDVVDGEGIDPDSIVITVDGDTAYDGSAGGFQGDYTHGSSSVTPITDGFSFTIFRIGQDWESFKQIDIRVECNDLAPIPNYLDVSWFFRVWDHLPPVLYDGLPAGLGVPRDADVSFSIDDEPTGSGVQLSGLIVTIGGELAVDGGVPQAGFQGPNTSITPNATNGYDVVIDKESEYPSFTPVMVSVQANDNEGNVDTTNYPFTTEDWQGPLVEPTNPHINEVDVDIDTNIVMEIIDDDLVDESTIQVEIDRGSGFEIVFRYWETPQFKDGWDGPSAQIILIPDGWRLLIDPILEFSLASRIRVRVTAKDRSGNPARLS